LNTEIIKEVKRDILSRVAEETNENINNVIAESLEAEKILSMVESDSTLKIDLTTWGRYVKFSEVSDKQLFIDLLTRLVDLYGEGTKEATYNNEIRYNFNSNKNLPHYLQIHISLEVSPSVTGCKLIKTKVTIPERIEPEHIEEKVTLKCD